MHVSLHLSTLDVKDVDENLDISEDVLSLAGKIAFHESFLATTIPP